MMAAMERELPARLWRELRADPSRAPEHIALAAAQIHGPAAAGWVHRKGGEAGPRLARAVRRRHARMARLEGAAMGFGGAVTVLPDLVLLAWIQARMVFFLAAAYGLDPTDPMRPAELLFLQRVYPDPAAARAALDGTGKRFARAYVESRVRGHDELLATKLLKMVAGRAGSHLAGRAIPGIAIAVNAIGDEASTRELARRAMRFYSRPEPGNQGPGRPGLQARP